MQQIKINIRFFLLLSLLFLFSCSDTASTSEKNNKDSSTAFQNADTTSKFVYDPALDPLTVGAAFAKKWGDTLNMKMFEITLNPGDSFPLHNHPDHAIYVLQGGKMAFNFGGIRDTGYVPADTGWIYPHIADIGKNIGNTTIKWIEVDVYRPRNK